MYFSLFDFLLFPAFQSKQKSRSHSFAPMNREKRQFVHEYCEHFGCQSQSYDDEPKKNIVATAVKGMVRIRVKTSSNGLQNILRSFIKSFRFCKGYSGIIITIKIFNNYIIGQ